MTLAILCVKIVRTVSSCLDIPLNVPALIYVREHAGADSCVALEDNRTPPTLAVLPWGM